MTSTTTSTQTFLRNDLSATIHPPTVDGCQRFRNSNVLNALYRLFAIRYGFNFTNYFWKTSD